MVLFLIAQIAGRTVAIESGQVESVVDLGTIVPVPGAGRQVRGLAALRSRVVTVIDTRAALGLGAGGAGVEGSTGGKNRAVVTIVEGHHYAVLVDAVEDVGPFDLLPLSAGIVLDKGWHAVGRGIIERAGEPILAIMLGAMIPHVALAA